MLKSEILTLILIIIQAFGVITCRTDIQDSTGLHPVRQSASTMSQSLTVSSSVASLVMSKSGSSSTVNAGQFNTFFISN